jgi:hypothetical protein
MSRRIVLLCAAASAALATSDLNAATLFWQGTNVSGTLTGPNYSDGANPNVTPTSGDVLNIGGGGTATHSTPGPISFQKLRIGHNQAPGGTGTGTVTISDGAVVNLTVGATGAANAALWVGQGRNATLNIDGAGTTVSSARLIIIGYTNNTGNAGTVNITNGGTLTSTLGNISMGEGTGGTPNGTQGHLFVNGTVNVTSASADLNVGVDNATSSVTQTGGLIDVNDRIDIALGGSANSFYSISGGETRSGGAIGVGFGTSTGATFTLQGTGLVNAGGRFVMGSGTATGVTMNHSAGTLNTTLDVRVGDAFTSATSDATYNLSGTGVLNTTTGGIIGRRGVGRFFQSGGDANFGGTLSIGLVQSAGTETGDGLYEISDGDFTSGGLNIATEGTGQFRVVGDDGTVDINGDLNNNNTAEGLGTLAFELESGDLLSLIDVSGAATFNLGAAIVFDTSNAAPTQAAYDLLTAATITDNGIAFTGPTGWTYQIVPGGNGQILQVVVPEPASFGLIALTSLLALRRRRATR